MPSRSARSTFCIFMASTTASVSLALTSCPSVTAIDTTSPGIGHSNFLPVSAAAVTGISRAEAPGAHSRARRQRRVQRELAAGGAGVGRDNRDFDAELVRRGQPALEDVL